MFINESKLNTKICCLTQGFRNYTNLIYELKHDVFDVLNIENNLIREFKRTNSLKQV